MLGNVGKENHLGAGRIRLNWSRNIERKEKGERFLYTVQGKRGRRIGKKKERRNKEKKNTVVGREG
jgi:hypothetical protein